MQIPSGWLTDTLGGRWTLAAVRRLLVAGHDRPGPGPGPGCDLGHAAGAGHHAGRGLSGRGGPAQALDSHSAAAAWPTAASRWAAAAACLLSLVVDGAAACCSSAGCWAGRPSQWRVVFVAVRRAGTGLGGGVRLAVSRLARASIRWCNAAEAELIAGGRRPAARAAARRLRRAASACICGLFFAVNIGWIVLVSNLPARAAQRAGRIARESARQRLSRQRWSARARIVTGLCGTLLLAVAATGLLDLLFPSPASGCGCRWRTMLGQQGSLADVRDQLSASTSAGFFWPPGCRNT